MVCQPCRAATACPLLNEAHVHQMLSTADLHLASTVIGAFCSLPSKTGSCCLLSCTAHHFTSCTIHFSLLAVHVFESAEHSRGPDSSEASFAYHPAGSTTDREAGTATCDVHFAFKLLVNNMRFSVLWATDDDKSLATHADLGWALHLASHTGLCKHAADAQLEQQGIMTFRNCLTTAPWLWPCSVCG